MYEVPHTFINTYQVLRFEYTQDQRDKNCSLWPVKKETNITVQVFLCTFLINQLTKLKNYFILWLWFRIEHTTDTKLILLVRHKIRNSS